jgi:release factor glutamine methyltransferase
MPSVAERLARARTHLESAGLTAAEAALDAEVLARHVLQWDRAHLLSRGREPEPPDFAETYAALVARRARREPVAQIVGHREFWGLEFDVTPDVLVPRPETELIVEEAIAFARERHCRTMADVGTGSGCLAVSIARELPDVRVTAIDISPAALAVARRNARRHAVAERISFLEGHLLGPLDGRVDLIVSNPPYVPETEATLLAPEVRDHEPHAAIFGGPDGLDVLRALFADAPGHLAEGGRLVVEFGFGQRDAIVHLAQAAGWNVLRVRDDLQGIPRTLVLTRNRYA